MDGPDIGIAERVASVSEAREVFEIDGAIDHNETVVPRGFGGGGATAILRGHPLDEAVDALLDCASCDHHKNRVMLVGRSRKIDWKPGNVLLDTVVAGKRKVQAADVETCGRGPDYLVQDLAAVTEVSGFAHQGSKRRLAYRSDTR